MVTFYTREELEMLSESGLAVYLENLDVEVEVATARLRYLQAGRRNFEIEKPYDVTPLKEWQAAQAILKKGFLGINETRIQDGLPPIPWGDTPISGIMNWTPDLNAPKMGETNETTE